MQKRKHPNPEKWEAKLGTNVFNPLEVLQLQDAIRERKKKARIGEREFLLKYMPGGKQVYYKPVDAFGPAGYLAIDRIMED